MDDVDAAAGAGRSAHRKRRKETATTAARRKNEMRRCTPSSHRLRDLASFDRSIFPLLLAAGVATSSTGRGARGRYARSILRRLLRSHLFLFDVKIPASSPPHSPHMLLPGSLLAVLPFLLVNRWPSVVALSAEIVGAAALYSIEMNEMIASDDSVMKGFVWALGSRNLRVVRAVCDAVMDISTTSVGRERLRQSFVAQRLLSLFCQVQNISPNFANYPNVQKIASGPCKSGFMDAHLWALILDMVLVLINTSTGNCLEWVPRHLVEKSLLLLKDVWNRTRGIVPSGDLLDGLPCITRYKLAETIFRLSMNKSRQAIWDSDEVRISIFGNQESDFGHFIFNHWENHPFLLKAASKDMERDSTIFSSLIKNLNSTLSCNILDSILTGSVSCPSIASDEMDIGCFLSEVSGSLGSPIIYGEDIRVLKAQPVTSGPFTKCLKNEVHFFENSTGMVLTNDLHVWKCNEAFQGGFTIALRGMEFRDAKVASIADGLAHLFGQPSVGVNLYLTPPRAQGLAPHYDDHCVFVWQLAGQKQWNISRYPTFVLPRLYEPLHGPPGLENDTCGEMEIVLKEGDILYVPRGYLHEAHTMVGESGSQNNLSSGFSLHLTLAIEVEPPFEWEGFAHIALHCWHLKQKQASDSFLSSTSRRLRILSIIFLHVVIRTIADTNPILRKACLVVTKFSMVEIAQEVHAQNVSIFHQIIGLINSHTEFMETFESMQRTVDKRDNHSLLWMRWLHHLPQAGDEDEKIDFTNPLAVFVELIDLYHECFDTTMAELTKVKCNFCKFVDYEDVCQNFNVLLQKYKKTRQQYMEGMLSLHSI